AKSRARKRYLQSLAVLLNPRRTLASYRSGNDKKSSRRQSGVLLSSARHKLGRKPTRHGHRRNKKTNDEGRLSRNAVPPNTPRLKLRVRVKKLKQQRHRQWLSSRQHKLKRSRPKARRNRHS